MAKNKSEEKPLLKVGEKKISIKNGIQHLPIDPEKMRQKERKTKIEMDRIKEFYCIEWHYDAKAYE